MVDLHTHSIFSDGTFTPAELCREAERRGLAALALCDHNTVAGLAEFTAAAAGSPVEGVPGIEISTDYGGVEVHIVGLYLRAAHIPTLTELLESVEAKRRQRNLDLIEKLHQAGYAITYDEVAARSAGHINRANIAALLTEKGYTPSVKAAFDRLLGAGNGFYVPAEKPDVFEVIELLASLGAIPVLAHPFLNLTAEELEAFLPQAAERGLAAMETRYPLFSAEEERAASALAQRFGLLESGGSDFHGANKPDIGMGVGKGDLAVPDAFWKAIKARAGA